MNREIKETIDYLKVHEINLAFRINELLKYFDELQIEKKDYKLKCEKAIEYIKDNLYYCVDNDDTNLLNILKGSE